MYRSSGVKSRRLRFAHREYSNVYFDFFYDFSETFLIPKETERDMIKNVYWFSRKGSVFSCPILIKYEYFGQSFE